MGVAAVRFEDFGRQSIARNVREPISEGMLTNERPPRISNEDGALRSTSGGEASELCEPNQCIVRSIFVVRHITDEDCIDVFDGPARSSILRHRRARHANEIALLQGDA